MGAPGAFEMAEQGFEVPSGSAQPISVEAAEFGYLVEFGRIRREIDPNLVNIGPKLIESDQVFGRTLSSNLGPN